MENPEQERAKDLEPGRDEERVIAFRAVIRRIAELRLGDLERHHVAVLEHADIDQLMRLLDDVLLVKDADALFGIDRG